MSTKITETAIMDAAFSLLRTKGISSVTARKLANELDCSTHSIYQIFHNMESLHNALYKKAMEYFDAQISARMKPGKDLWLEYGISYIKNAYYEKNIYRFIFVEKSRKIKNIEEYMHNDDKILSLQCLTNAGMSMESSESFQEVHLLMRIFAQGLAGIVHNCEDMIDEDRIRELLEKSMTFARI